VVDIERYSFFLHKNTTSVVRLVASVRGATHHRALRGFVGVLHHHGLDHLVAVAVSVAAAVPPFVLVIDVASS
jgi:hypothetical protein